MGATVIAIAFYIIHSARVNEALSTTKLMAAAIFDHEDSQAENYIPRLRLKAQSLLAFRNVHAVALMSQKGEMLFSAGLPISPKVINDIRQGALSVKQGNLLTFTSPIGDSHSSGARLLIEVDRSVDSIAHLQFLFVCTIVVFGVLVVTIYLNRRLMEDIFDPLEDINEEIERNNSLEKMTPLNLIHPGIYGELVEKINVSFTIQNQTLNEFRKNVEVATHELRESLETVEIQNIDLDIARKNATELSELKSEFLRKTSQDLQTPLRGILSFIELVRNHTLNADQKEYLATIEESTRGMLDIVNDINDFSRLESGNLQLEQKPFDMRSIIESSLILQAPAAQNSKVTLYSTFETKLPNILLGDPLRIQQVVSNLISNAIKFDNANYVYVRTELIHQRGSDLDIVVDIQTDGRAPRELNLWLDQDYELKNISKAFYSHAGMGLVVAKGLCQHMNGNVDFRTDEKYSTFTLELKCYRSNEKSADNGSIDSTYKANAVVFSNNDIGYREIASRLSELSIKVHRAHSFSEISSIAQRLSESRQKHARYLPLAVIEAQTSHQTLDKIVLTQTLKSITDELDIPTMVIVPSGKHESLQKTLSGVDVEMLQQPVISSRFRSKILELLGIVKLKGETPQDSQKVSLKPIKVLVVEDNLANVKLAKALLSDFNVETSTAFTGQEALEISQKINFDLVLMDIELPDTNGYETTKLIRDSEHLNKRVPIVALTAHDVSEEKSKLLLAGMDDVIGKPLTTKAISTILDRWVISTQINQSTHSASENVSALFERVENTPVPVMETDTYQKVAEASPVNISECLNLAKNDASLAKDMLAMLLDMLPAERRKVNECATNADIKTMYEVVHKLYGACCYCGLPRLKSIAKTLDVQLKNQNEDQLIAHLEEFFNAIDELLAWQENHDIDALFD